MAYVRPSSALLGFCLLASGEASLLRKDDGKHPPAPAHAPRGIFVKREVNFVEEGSSLAISIVPRPGKGAGGCIGKDIYGDDRCGFAWGTNMHLKVGARLKAPLEQGSVISFSAPPPFFNSRGPSKALPVYLRRARPVQVECPACSPAGLRNCTVPFLNRELNIRVPPCPVKAGDVSFVDADFTVPHHEMTANLEGRMTLNIHVQREDGSDVGKMVVYTNMGPIVP
mmetsp:Transcript_64275/g.182515  ORF Transcript_64275/g.182515 Transcript_64275/m.182515 type:complete len:226 (-) Transcript_64275:66-743(-)